MYMLNFYLRAMNKRLNQTLFANSLPFLLVFFFLLFPATSVFALKDDVTKPVYINADSVIFNKSKGFAVYEGNVSIVQGSLEIKAWKIEIKAPNNKIRLIEAKGSPVSFKQKMDDGKIARGTAKRVRYLVDEKRLILDGDAVLSQNNDKFSSNHIEYLIRTGELKAGATPGAKKTTGKSRVRAIFYPSNKAK